MPEQRQALLRGALRVTHLAWQKILLVRVVCCGNLHELPQRYKLRHCGFLDPSTGTST